MKFNNIRLLVQDFDRCFNFYNNILGLSCTWGKPGDNFASFDIGIPSGLCLFKAELMDSAIGIDQQNTPTKSLQDRMAIIIEVDDVDETYLFLVQKGIEFLAGPRDMVAWGIRVAHFRDPENNLIELYSELSGT